MVAEREPPDGVPAAERKRLPRGALWVALALEAAALATLALPCQHGERATGVAVPSAATAREHPSIAPVAPQPVDAGVLAARDASDAADPRSRTASTPNAVARMLRITDDADRTLLSEIERTTRSGPPPAVHELIALRRTGAPRAELERAIVDRLGSPVVLRLAAMRWLNRVAPPPGATREAIPSVPAELGQGGGSRRIQKIEPRR